MIPKEVQIRQWFHASLTEKEGQTLIGHIQGTKRYNLLVPYNDLPEQAKEIIRSEYEKILPSHTGKPDCPACAIEEEG